MLSLSIGTLAIIAQAVLIFAFPEGNGDFNLEKGYALAGLVVAVVLITPGAVILLFVKERDLLNQKKVKTGILSGIKITMSNSPFLFVVAVSLLILFDNNNNNNDNDNDNNNLLI